MNTPDETAVAELFSRDPLALSEQDLDRIIERLRSQRARYVQGNVSAGKPASKKTAAEKKGEAALKTVGDIDLGDLGL